MTQDETEEFMTTKMFERKSKVKAAGQRLEDLMDQFVKDSVGLPPENPDYIDPRCMAVAKTYIQTGIMWAVRGMLKPEQGC